MENTPTQEMITKIIAWIEASTDFAKEQWPDYISQYMKAETIKTWVNVTGCFLIMILLLILGIYCIWYTWNWQGKSYDIPTVISMGTFMSFILMMIPFGMFIEGIHRLITLYVAPKVYMLQHLKGFLK